MTTDESRTADDGGPVRHRSESVNRVVQRGIAVRQ
jgi:hypothetical protein